MYIPVSLAIAVCLCTKFLYKHLSGIQVYLLYSFAVILVMHTVYTLLMKLHTFFSFSQQELFLCSVLNIFYYENVVIYQLT